MLDRREKATKGEERERERECRPRVGRVSAKQAYAWPRLAKREMTNNLAAIR